MKCSTRSPAEQPRNANTNRSRRTDTERGMNMGKTSRDKGKVGERELASRLRGHGYDCRRGQQFSGANGDADVVGLPGIHCECKRTERLNLYDAMSQAIHDARPNTLPAVFSRKNHCEWLVTMRLDDWIELFREWEAGHEKAIQHRKPHNL